LGWLFSAAKTQGALAKAGPGKLAASGSAVTDGHVRIRWPVTMRVVGHPSSGEWRSEAGQGGFSGEFRAAGGGEDVSGVLIHGDFIPLVKQPDVMSARLTAPPRRKR
jgi:hypothetical protein